jgi:hypothetical protein
VWPRVGGLGRSKRRLGVKEAAPCRISSSRGRCIPPSSLSLSVSNLRSLRAHPPGRLTRSCRFTCEVQWIRFSSIHAGLRSGCAGGGWTWWSTVYQSSRNGDTEHISTKLVRILSRWTFLSLSLPFFPVIPPLPCIADARLQACLSTPSSYLLPTYRHHQAGGYVSTVRERKRDCSSNRSRLPRTTALDQHPYTYFRRK